MNQYIFNVSPLEHWEGRTYGTFHLLPRENGKRHSPPVIVIDQTEPNAFDFGEGRFEPKEWRAEDVAKDLVSSHIDTGCFIAAGPKPTEEELQAAETKWQEWCQRKIAEADMDWARTPRFELISDDARKAAKELRIERPWLVKVRIPAGQCEFCGADLQRAGLAKCPSCQAVLDIDKALAAGIITKEQAKDIRAARRQKPVAEEVGAEA